MTSKGEIAQWIVDVHSNIGTRSLHCRQSPHEKTPSNGENGVRCEVVDIVSGLKPMGRSDWNVRHRVMRKREVCEPLGRWVKCL